MEGPRCIGPLQKSLRGGRSKLPVWKKKKKADTLQTRLYRFLFIMISGRVSFSFDLLQPDTRAEARQRQLKREEDRDTTKKAAEFWRRSVHQKLLIRPKVHPHWSLVVVTSLKRHCDHIKAWLAHTIPHAELEVDTSQELTLARGG